MADQFRVIISPKVFDQIEAIYRWIYKSSPQGAGTVGDMLVIAMESLDILPGRFRIYESRVTESLTVRAMPVPPYMVYYRIDERQKVVRVISALHGAGQSIVTPATSQRTLGAGRGRNRAPPTKVATEPMTASQPVDKNQPVPNAMTT